tara:strand:- start:995 stop:1492 length:498 start_codon:yes stop_codon:yes gene_type:complete
MAYFAQIDSNKIVTQVIGCPDGECGGGTIAGEAQGATYLEGLTGISSSQWKICFQIADDQRTGNIIGKGVRGNYPGVGMTFMEGVRTLGVASTDVFMPPPIANSWTVGVATATWYSPLGGNMASKNIGINSTDALAGKAWIWCENEYQADTSDPKTVGWALTTFS